MKKQLALLSFLLTTTFAINAQNNLPADSLTELKNVVVTYQAGDKTPVTFLNLYARELDKKSTGQEPSFIFSETPSITAYSDAGNTQGYSYYRLRGIDQTRINVTLDGVPMNEPEDQGGYFSNFPDLLNSVSKVQIQRGTGTSKNGSAGYAGSIELFSPDLSDSQKTTVGIGYGSYNSFRIFSEYNSGIKNHKSFYVRASQVYSDGYKYHSSNNGQSVFASGALYFPKSILKLNVLAGHQRNKLAWLGVTDSLIDQDRRTNANSDEKDQFFQTITQVQYLLKTGKRSSMNISAYYTYLKGNYDFDLNNFTGLPSTSEMYNYAFQSNYTGVFGNYTREFKNMSWISGVHLNTYNRQHTGSERSLGRLYRNTGYKNDLSLFSKAEWRPGNFLVFADVQYRHTTFRYDGSTRLQKLSWDFINPKAGISYSMNGHTDVYYSIGRTSREPTRNDMFGGNDDLPVDSLGNPVYYNTAAESVIDQELGFRYQTSRLKVCINGYYMGFKNEIVLNGQFGPNGLALTNKVTRSYRTGIELSAMYKINRHFRLINHSSFNYSRIKEQHEVFQPILTPTWIINQEIAYEQSRWTLGLSGRYQSSAYIDFANTASVDDYLLLNARLGYSIKQFTFAGFLNNITDSRYFNNGYVAEDGSRKYFVQAPLNFYVAASYSF